MFNPNDTVENRKKKGKPFLILLGVLLTLQAFVVIAGVSLIVFNSKKAAEQTNENQDSTPQTSQQSSQQPNNQRLNSDSSSTTPPKG